jgi:hypothetical protein
MQLALRPRKSIKYLGIFATVFFALAVIGYGSLFFVDEPTAHGFKSDRAAAVMATFGVILFSVFFLLSLFTWASYHVEQFSIEGTRISLRSVVRNLSFDAEDLHKLSWQTPLGRAIAFQTAMGKAKLDLTNYERAARLQIIRLLRDLVPKERQERWPEFCQRVALPLRDGVPARARANPLIPVTTITRSRYDRLFIAALPVVTAAAVSLGLTLGFWQLLLLPFVMAGFWLLLRLSVPPEGRRFVCATRLQLIGALSMPLSMVTLIGLRLAGFEKPAACWVALAVMLPAVIPMMRQLLQDESRRRAEDELASATAPSEWDAGEMQATGQAVERP